jgi:hypothetical protein
MIDTATLPAPVVPSVPNCRIEEVFDSNFIELLRLAPKNPSVRALILKLTGKIPPSECETAEQVKEWVETACERRTLPARRGGPGISIRVDFSENECGLAQYSVRRSGTDQFEIDADDLTEIVRTAIAEGDGLEGIVGTIAARIDDDACNQCNPQLDDYGDYDYSDHESRDSADSQVEFSRSQIRQSVLAFLRGRHPELAAEL